MTSAQNFKVAGFVQNLAIKAPCQTFSTANLTLSGLQTVNGVALVENDRVLVKDQTDPIENGIYTCQTSAWRRDGDWDGNRDVVGGTIVPAYRISDGFMVLWQVDGAPDQIEVGVDAHTFTSYFDPTGIPVAVTLQEVTDEGNTSDNDIVITSGSELRVEGGGDVDIRDGGMLFVRDATDADLLSITHDGTDVDINTVGTNNVDWLNIGNQMRIRDGAGLAIFDATDTSDLTLTHLGTSAVIQVNTTDNLLFQQATDYVFDDSVSIIEKAAANANVAARGQLWVRNDAPNTLMFTDDAGTDFEIAGNVGGIGGVQLGVVFGGYVDSAGTAEQVPSGWSATRDSLGNYTVTHNLGLNTANDLSIGLAVEENGQTNISVTAVGTNSFSVRTITSDANADEDWWFVATLNVAQ